MSRLTPLSQWLLRQPQQRVAQHADGGLDTPAFVERVAAWVAALESLPGYRFALYHRDSCEFLAILLALWQLRRVACIAGDNQPASVAQLRDHVDGFIGDFPAAADALGEAPQAARAARGWIAPDRRRVALEIFTSGSSGKPKAIGKTLAQLEAELDALQTRWPGDPGGTVLATVSHQHFYGLVIALLWPFCAARSFDARICEYPEDIIHRGREHARFTLVSSPSHLARFSPAFDWRDLDGRCECAYSSAAPLARAHSLDASALLAAPVREIYGSSETGAIAWRCQQESAGDAAWQALPGVRLAATGEGLLSVRAPYLDVESLVLPDRVAFDDDGGFRLLGRADRIAKVEGKRVSLTAIEDLLLAHDWVDEARALTLERVRVETAVVLCLSEAGETALRRDGRKVLVGGLRRWLDGRLEALAIPRRWRFVGQMPVNAQGKLPLDNLLALFEEDGRRWPQILERRLSGARLVLHCRIPPELEYFDGHMPGRPVLPGIAQVHWAEAFARRWLPLAGRFRGLEAIKFHKVILPGCELRISLEYWAESGKLEFYYQSEQGVHSRGRIRFTG